MTMLTKSRMTAPAGRGDDADAARKRRQRPLAFRVKEAFALELPLDLLEGQLERPRAHGLDVFGDNLHLAALLVDRQPAAQQDVQAIFRTEAEQPGLAAEKHHRELCRIVF